MAPFLIALVLALLLLAGESAAQFTGPTQGTGGRKSTARASCPSARTTVVTREIKVKGDTVNVKVSSLTVLTAEGAKVVLENSLTGAKHVKKEIMTDASRTAVFDNITPGKYLVKASKNGTNDRPPAEVVIPAQKSIGVNLELFPITYALTIKTNLKRGEVKFAETSKEGNSGNYSVRVINPNGFATYNNLEAGVVVVGVESKDDLQFEPRSIPINVPADLDKAVIDEKTGEKYIPVNLEEKISTETFGSGWTADEWDMPAGWSLERKMKVKGDGVALPRNPRFRYYVGFEMVADVKIKDGSSAAFVLWARDTKNYYLLTLSGSKADSPNSLSIFTVKDGVVGTPLVNASLAPFKSAINSDNPFRLIVHGEGGDFKVFIENPDTGRRDPITSIADPYNVYRKGAVGIASFQKSNFEVSYMEVCPGRCGK